MTVAIVAVPYPFLPRHLTLVSMLTIGCLRSCSRWPRATSATAWLPPSSAGGVGADGPHHGHRRDGRLAWPAPRRSGRTSHARRPPSWPWSSASSCSSSSPSRSSPGRSLIASMGGLFALAMVIPKTAVLRPLHPTGTLVEALVIGAAAGAVVVVTWRVARHRLEAAAPRRRRSALADVVGVETGELAAPATRAARGPPADRGSPPRPKAHSDVATAQSLCARTSSHPPVPAGRPDAGAVPDRAQVADDARVGRALRPR